jgi:hypothetical protein
MSGNPTTVLHALRFHLAVTWDIRIGPIRLNWISISFFHHTLRHVPLLCL